MIRYEYEDLEEEAFPDHKMPIVRPTDIHPTVSHHQPHPQMHNEMYFPEGDWLNPEAIDEYAQHFNAETFDSLDIESVFDEVHPGNYVGQSHNYNDSLFDSHHTSYYNNTSAEEEHIQNENNVNGMPFHDYYHPQSTQNHSQSLPLRTRDINTSTRPSTSSKQAKKKTKKPPSQRRPIDEYPTKNGFKKPLFSYSCLIGLALRNSERGELTVAEIYRFLCEHFPFFREAPSGWKNSVRHNLSLNKCFQKVEILVPDAQGRRSCLWRINPAKLDRMASEINKWKERSAPSISLAMDNPNDLDDIINGKKGMPHLDDMYLNMNAHDDENEFVQTHRPKERVIYISRVQELNKNELQRSRPVENRQPIQVHSVPAQNKYVVRQPLRCIKQENYDEEENSVPLNYSSPSTSSHQYKLNQSSIHERAMRNLESLLERKKHSTVYPRDGVSTTEDDVENQENFAPSQHLNKQDVPEKQPEPVRATKQPLAIRIQRSSF